MPHPPGSISRRDFSRGAVGALALLSAHDLLMAGHGCGPEGPSGAGPLIRSITLRTAVPLAEMRAFYAERLGLAVVESTPARLVLRVGATLVEFVAHTEYGSPRGRESGVGAPAAAHDRGPFYHFAFNIPPGKVMAARAWLLERTALVPTPAQLRDPAYPDDVRHFASWNAHSLFFFDPAYNIVEFIARHDLPPDPPWPAGDGFGVPDILYASEIGYVVAEPARHARVLHEALGLSAFPRGTDNWWAMGDERGLILCLPTGRVFGENTTTPKAFDVFETEATVALAPNRHTKPVVFEGLPYTVNIQS